MNIKVATLSQLLMAQSVVFFNIKITIVPVKT